MHVVGMGAVTAVGRTVLASAAAVRAGITGFSTHAFMADSVGRPLHVAQCPWLDATMAAEDRIASHLVHAIDEALTPLARTSSPRPPVTLLVSLPATRPGSSPALHEKVRRALDEAFGHAFARIGIARLGHAGGLVALQSAAAQAGANSEEMFLVAAADSWIHPDALEWLEEADQLHGAGERNNAWGFVPGEGAGALLLASPAAATRYALTRWAHIRALGSARESKRIHTETVCIGEGLTAAFRGTFGVLPREMRMTDVYCDMNGEPYRADEYAFAVVRTRERFVSASDFVAPADCWGDVGTASGPLLVALACVAGRKRYSKGGCALVWASSEDGDRSAVVIEATQEGSA